jgi:uncharacterized lipoprotein YajG
MKFLKILLPLSIILFATSCVSDSQIIKADYEIDKNSSSIGEGISVEIEAFDNRRNSNLIGFKKFGDKLIKVRNGQNIENILREKVALNLLQRGFTLGRENVMKIYLEHLDYSAKLGFIGKSEIKVSVKVEIEHAKNDKKFSKNYNLSGKRKHFITPLKSTDEKILNEILQEITYDIINDDEIIKFLVRE